VINIGMALKESVRWYQRMDVPAANKATAVSVCAVTILTALAVLPVFLVDIPAMGDYPNHLARMYLLSANGTSSANPYYVVHWTLCPNLAMDLIVPALARFVGVPVAMKAFLVISQALIISGAIALEIIVQRRHQLAGFVAVTALYSLPFALGLLNFEFGMGLALWGIACWVVLENRPPYVRLVVHSLFAVGLYGAHILAMGLYGATLGFYFLSRIWARELDAKRAALTLIILATPALAVFGYVFGSGDRIGNGETEWIIISKILSLFIMNGYSTALSAFNLALIVALLYWLFRCRSLSLTSEGRWIAGGFLVLFVAMPFHLAGSAYDDVRVAIAAVLVLPPFLVHSLNNRIVQLVPPFILAATALVNIGNTAAVWFSYVPEYAAIKSSFARIERGAFVLVSHSGTGQDPPADLTELPIHHAPVLAVHYARAFVPSLYTIPGMYVVQARPELSRLNIGDTHFYSPVPFWILARIAEGGDIAGVPPFVRCWMYDFNYLYLVGPQAPNPMPARLVALANGNRFTLYEIHKLAKTRSDPAADARCVADAQRRVHASHYSPGQN
jgi:hypothetical protein